MNDIHLPGRAAEKIESRWVSRLAAEAAAWRRGNQARRPPRTIIDRRGKLVPVAFRSSTVTGRAGAFTHIA
jgi:hypothetical protein